MSFSFPDLLASEPGDCFDLSEAGAGSLNSSLVGGAAKPEEVARIRVAIRAGGMFRVFTRTFHFGGPGEVFSQFRSANSKRVAKKGDPAFV